MNDKITAALSHLVAATGREYRVEQQDGEFVLIIPTGGTYDAVDEWTMLVRLTNLRIAAIGREAR